MCYSLFFFFFQAEDGIRDHCVTRVQTCALPISERQVHPRDFGNGEGEPVALAGARRPGLRGGGGRRRPRVAEDEIGRASCRERVWMAVVAGAVKKRREGEKRTMETVVA